MSPSKSINLFGKRGKSSSSSPGGAAGGLDAATARVPETAAHGLIEEEVVSFVADRLTITEGLSRSVLRLLYFAVPHLAEFLKFVRELPVGLPPAPEFRKKGSLFRRGFSKTTLPSDPAPES